MDKLLQLVERFKEPSSWAGLAAFAGMVGFNLDPGVAHGIALVGAGVCTLVAIFVPEKSK